MLKPHRCSLYLVTFLLPGALLCACSGTATKSPSMQGENANAMDFSGSWELDYGQSDNVQQKLDSLVRELQRNAERRAQTGVQQGPVIGLGINGGAAILGVVRLADQITQSPLLEIRQDTQEIRVQREGDFDLSCEFHPGKLHRVETPFGTEICGWKAHQLVFSLFLPDGLRIEHVMTVGAAGQKLNIATTVMSGQVSFPFLLNRVYNRFEPGATGYHCEMTLTRGRVCTTESQ